MTVHPAGRHVGARGGSARACRRSASWPPRSRRWSRSRPSATTTASGLIIFTDQVERFVPPKKGKKHVLRVVSEILSFEPRVAAAPTWRPGWSSWATWRAGAVGRLPGLRLPGAGRVLRARAAHRRAPPRPGAGVGHRSAGGGAARRSAWSSSRIPRPASWSSSTPPGPRRRAFAREARAHDRGPRRRCSSGWTMDAIEVRTDRPYLPALTTFFEARARRLRH